MGSGVRVWGSGRRGDGEIRGDGGWDVVGVRDEVEGKGGIVGGGLVGDVGGFEWVVVNRDDVGG